MPEIPTQAPQELERLLVACGGPEREQRESESWGDLVRGLLQTEVQSAQGEIRGAIVVGFPFGYSGDKWLRIIEEALSVINNPIVNEVPRADTIWNATIEGSAVARGSGVFGTRLRQGLPTYFDTLPEFEVYALTRDGGSWERLVRGTEAPGGRVYRDVIQGEFALSMGQDKLQAYLRLHDGEQAPIKLTSFSFPRGPDRQMPLDLRVEVRPAGGLAVVEMVPEDLGFMGGVHVYLDYEEMEEVDSVPDVTLDYPPIVVPHDIDPDDGIIFESSFESVIDGFLNCEFGARSYERCLKLLQRRLSSATLRDAPGQNRKRQFRIVNLDGRTATSRGRKLVGLLSEKIGRDFVKATSSSQNTPNSRAMGERLLVTGAWLFGAVPLPIHRYVIAQLGGGQPSGIRRNVINAAGRILKTREDIAVFFSAMEASANAREREERWLTIDWLWSVKRLLSAREAAAHSLDHDQVVQIYRFLFYDLQSWIEGERVNGFGATLHLLFYLFRYRIVERNFLAPGAKSEASVRRALVEAVDEASRRLRGRRSFLQGSRRQTALAVLAGLKDFLDFRGSMDIIEKLSEFDELSAD